jgi:murein DD-endopeptidase MepM/ murein hydrolase activator NlpD
MISYLPKQVSSFTSALYAGVCNFIPLKSRYLLTKQNRPRLRYAACGVALVALLSFGGSENSPLLLANSPTHGEESLAELLAQQNNPDLRRSSMSLGMAKDTESAAQGALQTASLSPKSMTVKIDHGETLRKALMDAGLERDAAQDIMNEVAGEYNLRELKAGQKLDVSLVPSIDNTTYQLASMSMKIDPIRTLKVTRDEDGSIDATLDEKEVVNITRAARVVMDGSVYASADKAGLPDRVTARAIKLFSHAIDFQRDVNNGDKLEVLYESQETKDGYIAKTGEIIFARMMIGGKEQTLYRFKNDDGSFEYYTEKGKSIRQGTGLLKTPISFGRVTSGFGMRRHPIMGYTKMHKGIDFGAPTGTPIYAAADGVIEKAGRFSAYGNYVRIRHNSKLHTAYAHISRFANGIRPGTRVKQGQTIAYVGNTGRSTGPHLHYEVHVNGVAVNPRSVKYSSDNNLKGNDLKKFQQFVQTTNQEYARRASGVNVASAKKDPSSSVE